MFQKKQAMLETDPRAEVQQNFAINYISQRPWLQRLRVTRKLLLTTFYSTRKLLFAHNFLLDS